MMAELDILNGFASKIISDCLDITVGAIKKAYKNRKAKNQTIETRIYQVTVDALNEFSYNEYKGKERVYDAAESILKQFKSGRNDYKEVKDAKDAVKTGLEIVVPKVNDDICEIFLQKMLEIICKEENRELATEHIINQGEQVIFQQKQTDKYMQEGFRESHKNQERILKDVGEIKEDVNYIKEDINNRKAGKIESGIPVENRAEEYALKWNENVFLNNFDEEDENIGTENKTTIKLCEIYKEECLPHYIWKKNSEPSKRTLRDLLKKYIIDMQNRKMLLILGQPGIGKSTLITWIMANLVERKDDILVYQFASDLGSINWQGENILDDIFKTIGLGYDELENKTMILDGFDEIYAGGDRERILNKLTQELRIRHILKKFSLIITCRQNYIYNLQNLECDYITLQAWNETQIGIFCRVYWKKCKSKISENAIQKILAKKEIFGIPLILYMILALNVDIEKSSSIVDIYDKVFSLKRGGIYDRCYDTEHRINSPVIKKHIHQISQRIAFWIFENNADKASISQEKFIEICEKEMRKSGKKGEEIQNDTMIGNFFKLKHCEGMGTDELQFVHRSIYEYFVTIYFFESIHKLTSKEKVAGKLGELLKDGRLSEQVLEFIKYKFDSLKGYNLFDITKEVFNIMLRDGMTYNVKGGKYKNIITREMNIFSNMLKVVHLWNYKLGKCDNNIILYLQYNHKNMLNLRGADLRGADLVKAELIEAVLIGADLRGANLSGADLSRANLRVANLSGADLGGTKLIKAYLRVADLRGANLRSVDLSKAELREADLRGANLRRADLRGADLRGAELREADLRGAKLFGTVFDEKQVDELSGEYNIKDSRVYMSKTNEIITYEEYCIRKYLVLNV